MLILLLTSIAAFGGGGVQNHQNKKRKKKTEWEETSGSHLVHPFCLVQIPKIIPGTCI